MSANIRHSSASVEHFTPGWLVEKARYVLGGIDLDPASSEEANRVVRAPRIYTRESNGLHQARWDGRTILNPPGGLVDGAGMPVHRSTKDNPGGCTVTGSCGLPPGHKHEHVKSSAVVWWQVLCAEWFLSHVPAAFFVGFSLELLQSCQGGEPARLGAGHHPLDFYCCIPRERIKFDVIKNGVRVPGNQPTHSNVLVLLPVAGDVKMLARFEEAFGPVGYVHRGNGQYA